MQRFLDIFVVGGCPLGGEFCTLLCGSTARWVVLQLAREVARRGLQSVEGIRDLKDPWNRWVGLTAAFDTALCTLLALVARCLLSR